MAHVAAEISWLHSLLGELKVKKRGSSVVWVDNLSAIAVASDPVLHSRTKHFELDVHFVREKVLAKELELRHVPTSDQIADILTKPLSHQSLVRLREKLGVVEQSKLGLRGRVNSSCEKDSCLVKDEDLATRSTSSRAMNESETSLTKSVGNVYTKKDAAIVDKHLPTNCWCGPQKSWQEQLDLYFRVYYLVS